MAENYLIIKNINGVTVRGNKMIYTLLKEVSPRTFEPPFLYTPNIVQIDNSDWNNRVKEKNEYFNNKLIPEELEHSPLKFNAELDVTEINPKPYKGDDEYLNIEMLLSNDQHKSERIVILNCKDNISNIK